MIEKTIREEGGGTEGSVDTAYWRTRLACLMRQYNVPGAVLGILNNGQIIDVASGVLNQATLVPATPDALFQIGSVTKVWTATMIMQLIDEGRLALEMPVAEALPGFALSDPEAAKAITIRHLLTHTSGIGGDIFLDTGRGDECIGRYVARLSEQHFAQVHPVGETHSYCNAGYVILGRVIEVFTRQTWDAALRERIIAPLELAATVTLPEEAVLHRVAVGHITDAGSEPTPVPTWTLSRCMGPAGLIAARVHDVLAFARMHLDGGRGPNGRRILSSASARAMAEWHHDIPDQRNPLIAGDSRGLAWVRYNWGGHQVIGHSGGINGQMAFLRLLPDKRFAVALLTNGGDARGLHQHLFTDLFSELVGVSLPMPMTPPEQPIPIDAARHMGRYINSELTLEVLKRDGKFVLRHAVTASMAEQAERVDERTVWESEMVPVTEHYFAARSDESGPWDSVHFYSLPNASQYLHYLGRAYPRMPES